MIQILMFASVISYIVYFMLIQLIVKCVLFKLDLIKYQPNFLFNSEEF